MGADTPLVYFYCHGERPGVNTPGVPSAIRREQTYLGIDPDESPIPVLPTAHYAMGGIPTDIHGRVILDDKGRFSAQSSPAWEDFDTALPAKTAGNRSLIFMQTGNSWHGVRPIQCPEGELRKVFIVVANRAGPIARQAPGSRGEPGAHPLSG